MKGKRILVTRPAGQAQELAARLESYGAIPVFLPAIEIKPLEDPSALDNALSEIASFDWVVFTSVNGVQAVAEHISCLPIGLRIAAIGPSTASAVSELFRAPDVVPEEFVSEAIAPLLGDVNGKRILLARADIARQNLAHLLREAGAEMVEVAAYHIVPAASSPLPEQAPDVITATSAASARALAERFVSQGHAEWLQLPWVCIGPITAEAARSLGCNVVATAVKYTADGLVDALLKQDEESLEECASA